ncbi:tetratricopeptide repeat protein [Clostridium algidicarnis]|uniref:tetratricopeptide repeat protein n=1 Tax=Clostridium algidicarnis TaxID=37659 RepID=UPI0004983A27|nr:hypothetical protein [Clostridium algidicarnis]
MDIDSKFKQKLEKLIFIEVKKEVVEELFNTKLINKENIFIPVESSYITKEILETLKLESIPLNKIVKSIFLILGADSEFEYNNIYKALVIKNEEAIKYIKGEIASYVKEKNYEDAYLLLKGLISVDDEDENIEKAIWILETLRGEEKEFIKEELELIEYLKTINSYDLPYFYEALIYKDEEEYEKAILAIEECLKREGEFKTQSLELKETILQSLNYEDGKALIYDDPKKALEKLLPLVKSHEENPMLFYHIAVAYRIIGNYQKAIYYLNESRSIDSDILEVVNELGLNYASMGDYSDAIIYFKKGFEVSQSVEFCTNLAVSYLKIGDKKNAEIYISKGKEISPEDDIITEIERTIK